MDKDYLILGSGIAGLSAAQAIRELDPVGSMLIVTEERRFPCSRPMLTKTPLRTFDPDQIQLHPESWYRDRGIEFLLGAPVQKIDAEHKSVQAGDRTIRWKKCIYALGASNFIPPFPGAGLERVHSIRTAEDILQIRKNAADARTAVIIGGGVIGLEAAFELSRFGLSVTVLEALPFLMPRVLDEGTARDLQSRVHCFSIHTGVQIAEISGRRNAEAVRLEDGRTFPCDLAVVSCGVRASTGPARAAGIACGRAVLVNQRMETNVSGIYACGDCAEFQGVNAALWSQAVEQGKTAGANAAGGIREFSGCDDSLVLNSPDVSLFACGDLGKHPPETYRCEVSDGPPGLRFFVNPAFGAVRRRLFYRGDTLTGVSLLGNLSEMNDWKQRVFSGGTQ